MPKHFPILPCDGQWKALYVSQQYYGILGWNQRHFLMHFSRNFQFSWERTLIAHLLSTSGLFIRVLNGVEWCSVLVSSQNVKCCVNICLGFIHNVALDEEGICFLRLRVIYLARLLFGDSFWQKPCYSVLDVVSKWLTENAFNHLLFHGHYFRSLHKRDSCSFFK